MCVCVCVPFPPACARLSFFRETTNHKPRVRAIHPFERINSTFVVFASLSLSLVFPRSRCKFTIVTDRLVLLVSSSPPRKPIILHCYCTSLFENNVLVLDRDHEISNPSSRNFHRASNAYLTHTSYDIYIFIHVYTRTRLLHAQKKLDIGEQRERLSLSPSFFLSLSRWFFDI